VKLSASRIDDVLYERGRQILQVARAHGHRVLVLGAWGCALLARELSARTISYVRTEPRR
jgi:uncharacterized protein (TIGR02452 family)